MAGPTTHDLNQQVADTVSELIGRIAGGSKPTERHYRAAALALTKTIFDWYRENLEDKGLEDLLLKKLSQPLLARTLKQEDTPKSLLSDRTLRTILKEGSGATSSLAMLEAYHYVTTQQQEKGKKIHKRWHRLNGLWYQHNTHSRTTDAYQESLFLFQDGVVKMRYHNEYGNKPDYTMKVSWVSQHHLQLVADDVTSPHDDLTLFYLYVAQQEGQPDFLQGVYIYSNKDGEAVANLGIFSRVRKVAWKKDAEGKLVRVPNMLPIGQAFNTLEEAYHMLPVRRELPAIHAETIPGASELVAANLESRTVLQNVQYFLHRRGNPVVTRLYQSGVTRLFDFATDLADPPGPYHQLARRYRHYLPLMGDYYIYFNEGAPSPRSPSDHLTLRTDFHSTVVRGLMRLGADPISGALFCIVKVRKTESENLVYEGWIQNQELTNADLLNITLTLSSTADRCLNLLFNVVSDRRLAGGYTVAYSPAGQIGAGVTVALRQHLAEGTKPEDSTSSVNNRIPLETPSREEARQLTANPLVYLPTEAFLPTTTEQEQQIITYLSRNSQASLRVPSRERLEQSAPITHAGWYLLYYPMKVAKSGSNPSPLEIRTSSLLIYPQGVVYQFNENAEPLGDGKVEQSDPRSLIITLRDVKTGRSTTLHVRIDDVPPRDGDERIYLASYSSFEDEGYRNPVAMLLPLEFRQNTLPSPKTWQSELVITVAPPQGAHGFFERFVAPTTPTTLMTNWSSVAAKKP